MYHFINKITRGLTEFVFHALVISVLVGWGDVLTYASEPLLATFQSLNIKQEKSYKNGILVVRPSALDEKIAGLIETNQFQSVLDYAHWLQEYFTYQTDNEKDIWASPLETLNTRKGDCEDFAFLHAEILRVAGYKPFFLALAHPDGQAHAICAFQVQKWYFWFSNRELRKTQAESLSEFAEIMTKEFHYASLFQLDLETKRWNLLYRKS